MKYFIRAVKYFFYFSIIVTIIMAALVFFKVIDSNIELMFRNGYDSLWHIALMFAVISAFYPMLGFMKKEALIPGEYKDIRQTIVEYMQEKGYALENENGENLTFRLRNGINRLSRMYEDRISFIRNFSGFQVEGLRKDVVRIVYGLEYKFRNKEVEVGKE